MNNVSSEGPLIRQAWFPKLSHRGSIGLNVPLVGGGDEGIASCRDEPVLNNVVPRPTASYDRIT